MVVVKEIEENGEHKAAAAENNTATSIIPGSKDQQISELHESSKSDSATGERIHQTCESQTVGSKEDVKTSLEELPKTKQEKQATVADGTLRSKSDSAATRKTKTAGQKQVKTDSMQQTRGSNAKGKLNPGTVPKVKKQIKTVNFQELCTSSDSAKTDKTKFASVNQPQLSSTSSKGRVSLDACLSVKKDVKSAGLPESVVPLSKEKSRHISDGSIMSKPSSQQSAVESQIIGEKGQESISASTDETKKMEDQEPGAVSKEMAVAEIKENQKKSKNKGKKSSKGKNKDTVEKQKPSHVVSTENSSLDVDTNVSKPPSVDVSVSETSEETSRNSCNSAEVTHTDASVSSAIKEISRDMDTQNIKDSCDENACSGQTIPVKFDSTENPSHSEPMKEKYPSESSSVEKTAEQLRPVYNSKHWIKNIKERLKKLELHDEVMLEFSQCKTDTQRFACLYMQPVVHEVIHIEEWNKEKSEVQARVLRTSGNKSYQRKQFKESLEMYTESILKAPVDDDSSELALAFANRSAVFYHLKMYVLCLQDINYALKYGYPEHNRYKLYERKGKCCYHLKLKEQAITAFEQAIEFAEKAKLSDLKIDRLVRDLEKELDQVEKINIKCDEIPSVTAFNSNHGPIPTIEGKRNYQFPCMTSDVVLRYTEERGRGLFATHDIEVGEVLIIEKPYNSMLLKGYEMNHCHHCCNSLLAPLPCHQCSGVAFCSEECRLKAWELYHYAECKYLVLIEKAEIGMSHLALRMVLRAGFDYIKQYEQNKENTIYPLLKGCNKDGIYDSSDYHTVFNLEGHSKDRSVTDLLQRTLTSIFLVKCLKRTSYFPPITVEESASDFGKDEDEDHALIGSHILRHIQMLPCNAHEVSELDWNAFDFELSEICEFGSAIYPLLSLINHSCDPSVVRHSYGDVCVVRAIRNIYKHEEVLDSYGALYATANRSHRQEKLLSQYYFQCDCIACKNNWPEYSDIPQECPVLKCKKCFGPIFIPADGRNERAICSACREVCDITHDLLHLSRSEELYQDALEKTLKGKDLDQCLPILIKHLRLLDPLLCRPWRDYNNCQEAIKQCYSTRANCIKARKN